jgi:hypothetical protein
MIAMAKDALISTYLNYNTHNKYGCWMISNPNGIVLEYVQGVYKEVVHYAATLEFFNFDSRIVEIKVHKIDVDSIALRNQYLDEKKSLENRLKDLNNLLDYLPKGGNV